MLFLDQDNTVIYAIITDSRRAIWRLLEALEPATDPQFVSMSLEHYRAKKALAQLIDSNDNATLAIACRTFTLKLKDTIQSDKIPLKLNCGEFKIQHDLFSNILYSAQKNYFQVVCGPK